MNNIMRVVSSRAATYITFEQDFFIDADWNEKVSRGYDLSDPDSPGSVRDRMESTVLLSSYSPLG